jgi:hypothetical protein
MYDSGSACAELREMAVSFRAFAKMAMCLGARQSRRAVDFGMGTKSPLCSKGCEGDKTNGSMEGAEAAEREEEEEEEEREGLRRRQHRILSVGKWFALDDQVPLPPI